MNDTWYQILAALPPLLVALTIIGLFVTLCIARHERLVYAMTVGGLNLALVATIALIPLGAVGVTPLYVVDFYTLFFWGVILVATLAGAAFAAPYLSGLDDRREEFYILLATSALGAMSLVAARHFGSLFIGLEALSIPLYGMVAYTFRTRASLEAGFKYMILSGVASSFLLFGMALLYGATGSLAFADMVPAGGIDAPASSWMLMGIGMMLIALTFKLSLVPFHVWTPDVYEGAPAPVGTFLATVSKTAVFALLLRLFFVAPVAANAWLLTLIGVVAFVSMLAGNLLALRQDNLKRLLGYSSIAHLGYLLTTLVAGTGLSAEAVAVYLATYVGTSLGAFGVVSLVSSPFAGKDAAHIDHFRGLYYQRPMLAVCMALMMLSLAGIPLTMGFIGKFYILSVTMNAGLWWLSAGVIIGSGIALFYYLRVMAVLFMDRPAHARNLNQTAPGDNWATTVIWLLAGATVLMGIYPTPLIELSALAGLSLGF